MESHLSLMLKHNYDLKIDVLMILTMTNFRYFCLETHCDMLIGKLLGSD